MSGKILLVCIFISIASATKTFAQTKRSQAPSHVPANVTWRQLGNNENDSMPMGNGDIAANVWTEQNGDLVLLLAKANAWTETGSIVKLGRVRIRFNPGIFPDSVGFTQTLQLQNGSLQIKRGNNKVLVWIDANHPIIHVEAALARAGGLSAILEQWRKTEPVALFAKDASFTSVMSGQMQPKLKPDLSFPVENNRITWCHYNADSYYPYLMRQEHLEGMLGKYTDPLYQRCFGALMSGPGLVKQDEHTLVSGKAGKAFRLDIVALSDTQSVSPMDWYKHITTLADALAKTDINAARQAHNQWWTNFWNRSWIQVSGSDAAQKVSQGYAIQRYMIAASSRGELPVKFNGGLFTVGHDVAAGIKQDKDTHDPDYRAWGEWYWNQNNRLLYWPLIATGDSDLLKPWFNMYIKPLTFQKERNEFYYHHAGASYPETMQFWGMPRLGDFGKDNPTVVIQSRWQRYHVQGTLEVIAQMLDQYDYYGDKAFVRTSLVPFADAIITYYDQHWPRDASGKIYLNPMQSLETYQLTAVNPTPDIAGLMSVLPRMLALPADLTTPQQRESWAKTLRDLPPIPMGKTAKGKVPPLAQGDPNGTPVILPALEYPKPGNSENPELYVTFPYRLYGVGKPDLELVKNTYAARRSPQNTCWGQDGTQASIMGLTDEAKKAAIAEFTNYGDQRFQWFWKPAHDWIPDLDNGGSGMITLQNMIIQCDGSRIQLTPAWPADWTADFKLHAPYNTTVEGHISNGKVTNLQVTPASRAKDVVIVKQ